MGNYFVEFNGSVWNVLERNDVGIGGYSYFIVFSGTIMECEVWIRLKLDGRIRV